MVVPPGNPGVALLSAQIQLEDINNRPVSGVSLNEEPVHVPGRHILTFCHAAFESYPDNAGIRWHLWPYLTHSKPFGVCGRKVDLRYFG